MSPIALVSLNRDADRPAPSPALFSPDPDPPAFAVPFSRATLPPDVIEAVNRALALGALAGGGGSTAACHATLGGMFPAGRSFLTGSCTAALEMAALVLGIRPGDEVIMPSWTFPSTANAFALRGAVPVFVDVSPATLNIDPARVADAITPRTRAVCCVHYAGVACDMDALQALCDRHGLALIEDAAQAFGAAWRGRPLGGIGDFGAFSFHGTKNVSSGEGGALIVNRPELIAAAEIAWEKGTNRLQFQRGEAASYEWHDLGSSFLPSELTAALLAAQMGHAAAYNAARLAAWNRYDAALRQAGVAARARLPHVPRHAAHNAHIYAITLDPGICRERVVARLTARRIDARAHYRLLHRSPAGLRYARTHGPMAATDHAGRALLRLPLDPVIDAGEQALVVEALAAALAAEGG